MSRWQRFQSWMHKDIELDYAPWHTPKWRQRQGYRVLNIYGSHFIAALIYAGWKKVRS